MRTLNPKSDSSNPVTKKKRCGNASGPSREGRETTRARGEDRFVLRGMFIKKVFKGMKLGETRLLNFPLFFLSKIFSKFVAHKAPLELPFLSILLLGGNFAKKSGASVCVVVCKEFVL